MQVDRIQGNQTNFKALESLKFSRTLRRKLTEGRIKELTDSFNNNEYISSLCKNYRAKAFFDGASTTLGAKASLKLKLKGKHESFFKNLFKKPHEVIINTSAIYESPIAIFIATYFLTEEIKEFNSKYNW